MIIFDRDHYKCVYTQCSKALEEDGETESANRIANFLQYRLV